MSTITTINPTTPTTTTMPTIDEALGEYLVAQKVATEGESREDFYADTWFYATIGGMKVPVFPRAGFRRGLPAHDAHHMLTGYATNWLGECETAAWELASGGCGRQIAFWIDRLFFVLIALMIAPVRTVRAWRRGWGQSNLFRFEPDKVLAMDLAEARRYVGCSQPVELRGPSAIEGSVGEQS
jgi:hypothetical protein